MSGNANPNLYREERQKQGKWCCDICLGYWPISHMRLQSGLHVGVQCCWEPEGGDVEVDNRRAYAQIIAAKLTQKEVTPPSHDGMYYPGINPAVTNGYVTGLSPTSITLTRGGAAVAVTVTGIDFESADTIAYGAAGITDNSVPVLVSTTEWTLSVHASGGMAAGKYSLSWNGSLWPAVFDVR